MKILEEVQVNPNFPIWTFLCGDHALKREVELISPKLLSNPDFLNPLENHLRYEVFKSKRAWIANRMGDRIAFGLIQYSCLDLKNFRTCFSNISFDEYVTEYKRAHVYETDFKIYKPQHYQEPLTKSNDDVKKEFKLKKDIERKFKKQLKPTDILNKNIKNDKDLSVALNRCFIMKSGGNYIIMDGTHRLSAYYWSKKLDKNTKIPNNLYGFYWESSY